MNPRQIALVAWLLVGFVWAISQPGVRQSVAQVLKTVLDPQLFFPACMSLVWNAAVLFGFFKAGLWDSALWWDTAVFVLGGTTALVWRMNDSRDYSWRFYRKVLLETLGISVLFGVLVSNYTFGIAVELLLVPWLFMLGGLKAVSESDEKYSSVAKLVNFLIAFSGLAMLAQMIAGTLAEDSGFWSLLTIQSLLLVFLLTAAYLPFMFGVRCWMTYEKAFVPIRLGERKPWSLRTRAKLKIFLRHGFNLGKLESFRTGSGNQLRFATTRDAVDRVFEAESST